MKHVLFVAAENDALPNAKVGGVADVVRDLPAALADRGWDVTVMIPAYGVLHTAGGAKRVGSVSARFRGELQDVGVWEVPGSFPSVRNLVLDHPLFGADGAGQIYFADDADRPFATDANKFALLSAAAATFVENAENKPDVVHLHDWHAAFYCLLREYSSQYPSLPDIRTVFTIHNLSYQGVRPFKGDESSLASWFPELDFDAPTIADPVYDDCVNPMLTAIRLADAVSTVSPTYAKEICRASDPATGFIGGEGLEKILQEADDAGRLHGVLNGCYYDTPPPKRDWRELLTEMRKQVAEWRKKQPEEAAHAVAAKTLKSLNERKPSTVLLSIGRLVSQKATLFVSATTSGRPALIEIIDKLDKDALLIVLGSGERKYELALRDMAAKSGKILYLQGYAETLSESLYAVADLFLMPSSFEPCGISQLLAMRASLPCVVHSVGGLRDTVIDGETGFCFSGSGITEQADAFVSATTNAIGLRKSRPGKFQRIRDAAGDQRFSWTRSATRTIECLYE